jgi:hypothetical protein
MKMFKGCLIALIITMVSAFANASVISDIVSPHYELSQEAIDLGVQSDNVNSFELVEAHSEAFQVNNSEVIKQERSTQPAFVLKTSFSDQLIYVSEVGWRRSYNL